MTNTGIPLPPWYAAAAAAVAFAVSSSEVSPPSAAGASGQVTPPPAAQQLEAPSVTSRMYFGLTSPAAVSAVRSSAAACSAKRVGVLPPGVVDAIAAAMAAALFFPGAISAGPVAPQAP